MFSRIQSFISRHRRKLFGVAVTGAIIWGGWNYINWRMQRSEEEYVREVLKKAKRHMHHKSSAQAAEKQVTALVPVAAKAVNDTLDTSEIVMQLKNSSKTLSKDVSVEYAKINKEVPMPLTPEERIAKWDELKRISIARAVAYAYIPSVLIVFIRLQLGLLGGYVFKSCGGDNIAAFLDGSDEKQSDENQDSMPFEIQEAYLSLTQFFLEGQSNTVAQKQVDSCHESKDEYLVLSESYWGNDRGSSREGKSKLNLGQPMANSRCHSLGDSVQKHNDFVIPSNLPSEVQCCELNGIVSGSATVNKDSIPESYHEKIYSLEESVRGMNSSAGNDMAAAQMKTGLDKKCMVENRGISSVRYLNDVEKADCSTRSVINETPSICSKKSVPSVYCVSNDYGSRESSAESHEISPASISTEEVDELKDNCSRETTEEDSGRCSGTDDIYEDDVVDVRKSKSGLEVLCSLLEKKVAMVVDSVSLKTPLSLAETETLFWGILTSIRSNPAEDPAFNLPKYLLPPPEKIKETVQDIDSHLSKKAALLFNEMVTETSDLLETKEVVELVQSCVSAGLGHIMDRLANHFPADLCYGKPMGVSSRVKLEVQQKPTIPLAKLVPIISKVAFEDGYPWVKQLLEMGNLKDFGANVYEAFTH